MDAQECLLRGKISDLEAVIAASTILLQKLRCELRYHMRKIQLGSFKDNSLLLHQGANKRARSTQTTINDNQCKTEACEPGINSIEKASEIILSFFQSHQFTSTYLPRTSQVEVVSAISQRVKMYLE